LLVEEKSYWAGAGAAKWRSNEDQGQTVLRGLWATWRIAQDLSGSLRRGLCAGTVADPRHALRLLPRLHHRTPLPRAVVRQPVTIGQGPLATTATALGPRACRLDGFSSANGDFPLVLGPPPSWIWRSEHLPHGKSTWQGH